MVAPIIARKPFLDGWCGGDISALLGWDYQPYYCTMTCSDQGFPAEDLNTAKLAICRGGGGGGAHQSGERHNHLVVFGIFATPSIHYRVLQVVCRVHNANAELSLISWTNNSSLKHHLQLTCKTLGSHFDDTLHPWSHYARPLVPLCPAPGPTLPGPWSHSARPLVPLCPAPGPTLPGPWSHSARPLVPLCPAPGPTLPGPWSHSARPLVPLCPAPGPTLPGPWSHSARPLVPLCPAPGPTLPGPWSHSARPLVPPLPGLWSLYAQYGIFPSPNESYMCD